MSLHRDLMTRKIFLWYIHGECKNFMVDKYQITAVSFSDASDKIFTGVLDNDIKVRNIRKGEVTMTLEGHQDMITGMQLSPDGSYLLMNGMDNKLCIWHMRPFASQNRCVKIFEGHQHNVEKNFSFLLVGHPFQLKYVRMNQLAQNINTLEGQDMIPASSCIFLTLSLRLFPSLCGFFVILLHVVTIIAAVSGCSATLSGSNKWYAAHMVSTSLTAIFQGSVSVLIFTQTGDFLGYLKSYVREEDGAVILKLAGGLCLLIFCLEWVVLVLAFLLRYYAFVEGNGNTAGDGSFDRIGKV
ncbi:hypothetical protein POTOM_045751 [Populus tomentosa]|uniref:Uncharacterized protein n=1 Tax=Populus tomentosa TaxID=118781 RepID=A0A8X7YHH9_POPTO|nr:hypothetical protein POTOM_045751 [Populus tomentosa]